MIRRPPSSTRPGTRLPDRTLFRSRLVGEAIAGDTFFFLSANRNKRGFAVDFRDPECQALLADLAAQADILVETFRPGTLESMGMDWESLHARNRSEEHTSELQSLMRISYTVFCLEKNKISDHNKAILHVHF